MKRTFTVATGQLDSQGDIINLGGIKMPETIQVTENFDPLKIVGHAELKREGSVLKATAEVPDRLLDCYPAIGFQVIESHMEGNVQVFDEIEIDRVGICIGQNVDETIKTIKEQTEI
jgi:hypothetical protein